MKYGIVFVCISSLSAPTVEVEIRNDAVKCSSVSRDLDFLFIFHSRKQLLAAVGAIKQSTEILGVLRQIGITDEI